MVKRQTDDSLLKDREKENILMAVLKVSQEDVLGILTKMDQYLFGFLMYFLILGQFCVQNSIFALKCNLIISTTVPVHLGSHLNTHANTGSSHMLSVNVSAPLLCGEH